MNKTPEEHRTILKNKYEGVAEFEFIDIVEDLLADYEASRQECEELKNEVKNSHKYGCLCEVCTEPDKEARER